MASRSTTAGRIASRLHPASSLVVTLAILLIAVSPRAIFAADRGDPSQTFEIAGLKVAAWIPPSGTPGPWPIIIFSHGFHGCSTQSRFLTSALAESGYAVFAPDHRDAACRNVRLWSGRPEAPFRSPGEWSDQTYADRVQDLEKLIDALSADSRFKSPPFDWSRLGLVGHSLGGYTVLDAAGAWGHGGDPRVKAVLALSPYSAPFLQHHTLSGLRAPVMYQGGTRDIGITPGLKRLDGAYDESPAPKYFVEFDGAGHFAWTDIRTADHAQIIDYSRAFLDKYLKGRAFPPALQQMHSGVSAIRVKE